MTANEIWTSPMMNGERPVAVLEEWRVVDLWWTDHAEVRDYRVIEVTRAGVRVQVHQVSQPPDFEWRDVDYKP